MLKDLMPPSDSCRESPFFSSPECLAVSSGDNKCRGRLECSCKSIFLNKKDLTLKRIPSMYKTACLLGTHCILRMGKRFLAEVNYIYINLVSLIQLLENRNPHHLLYEAIPGKYQFALGFAVKCCIVQGSKLVFIVNFYKAVLCAGSSCFSFAEEK